MDRANEYLRHKHAHSDIAVVRPFICVSIDVFGARISSVPGENNTSGFHLKILSIVRSLLDLSGCRAIREAKAEGAAVFSRRVSLCAKCGAVFVPATHGAQKNVREGWGEEMIGPPLSASRE